MLLGGDTFKSRQSMAHSLLVVFMAFLVAGTGCVAAKTTIPEAGEKCANGGIIYHLPERKFIISVTVDKDSKITAVAAHATDPLPKIDRQLEFCGSFHRNILAENSADFQVTTSGLLTSSDTESKPKVSEALKAVAKTAGYGSVLGMLLEQESDQGANCTPGLTHSIIIDPDLDIENKAKLKLCGIQFHITPPDSVTSDKMNARVEPGTYWGLFYRQDEPYILTTSEESPFHFSSALLAPNRSPIRYLPLEWNFFADSSSTIRFTGGMPTQYKEKMGSEALGLVSLPADVLDAYFSAIGSMFEKIGLASSAKSKTETAVASQETAFAEQERRRLLAEERLQACQQALASGDPTRVTAACQ